MAKRRKKTYIFILLIAILFLGRNRIKEEFFSSSKPYIEALSGGEFDKLKEELSLKAKEYTREYFYFDIDLKDYHISLFKGGHSILTEDWTKGTEDYLFLVGTDEGEPRQVKQFLLVYNFLKEEVTSFAIHPPGEGYQLIYADLEGSELEKNPDPIEKDSQENQEEDLELIVQRLEEKYSNQAPKFWGERVEGVISRIESQEKIVALTFDACGLGNDGYDREIIDFLIEKEISANLFINGKWIDKYRDEFLRLANNPLFEIANYGYEHKPLSVNGKSAYNIGGTKNIREVVEEILGNDRKIYDLTGKKARYFRSGTAYYDEIAVKIAKDLGYKIVNFDILGDAGATFSREEIIRACKSARPGSIIIFHMNRPEKKIAGGIIEGIKYLLDEGYSFVKLSDYDVYLR